MHKTVCSFSMALVVLLILATTCIPAQERKGAITGRVMDRQHAVLQGARVELQPNRKIAVSDNQGQFTIAEVLPGHYTVTISYVGFAPFSADVDVAAGATASVDAVLEVGARTEVVEVRAERQRGEVEAINRERTA